MFTPVFGAHPSLEFLSPQAPASAQAHSDLDLSPDSFTRGPQPSCQPMSDSSLCLRHRRGCGTRLGTALTTKRIISRGELAGGWIQEHSFPFQAECYWASHFSSLTLSFLICKMSEIAPEAQMQHWEASSTLPSAGTRNSHSARLHFYISQVPTVLGETSQDSTSCLHFWDYTKFVPASGPLYFLFLVLPHISVWLAVSLSF